MTQHTESIFYLFSRHPKYLMKLLFQFYPLSNDQIVKFKSEVDWFALSRNEHRAWDKEFIDANIEKWDWESLSANTALPWSIEFLKSFPDRFRGHVQTVNPALPWTKEFLLKYERFWNFSALPLNDGIPWSQELVLHPKIINKNLSYVNGDDLWTESFLLENANVLPWSFLCSNPYINWSEDLINKLSPYWKKAEKVTCDNMVSPWKGLSKNTAVPWNTRLIKKYRKSYFRTYGLDWNELSRNTNLPWQEENLLEKFKDKWNWNLVSFNHGVKFSLDQIEEYKDVLYWDSGPSCNRNLSSNQNLPWSIELIEKYQDRWSWWSLCLNPGIQWDEEMIAHFEPFIRWGALAMNTGVAWSLEFIIKNEKKLFSKWPPLRDDFDKMLWKQVFEPIISDDLAEQILYNLSNPFHLIKTYKSIGKNADRRTKDLERLVDSVLSIDFDINMYSFQSGKIEVFISIIQTQITKILVVNQNELNADIESVQSAWLDLSDKEQNEALFYLTQVYDLILELFKSYGIDAYCHAVVKKQKEMNDAYMSFVKAGGHVSQNYEFLHQFIENHGQQYLELSRLSYLLMTIKETKSMYN